ncbi:MAG: hypothetical protein PVJ95_07795 [Cellvibrionales bacterium]|jgi:hypothetical protein
MNRTIKTVAAFVGFYLVGGLLAQVTYYLPEVSQFQLETGKYGFIAGLVYTIGMLGLYFESIKRFSDRVWPIVLMQGSHLILITDFFIDGKRGVATWAYGVVYIAMMCVAMYFAGKVAVPTDDPQCQPR